MVHVHIKPTKKIRFSCVFRVQIVIVDDVNGIITKLLSKPAEILIQVLSCFT
jgi:hypothetical protein